MKDLKDFDIMQSKEIREGLLHPTEQEKIKVLIKHFIKEMSNKLGDINETIVKVSADCYPKERALGGKIKIHLVQAFNLLVQLEKAIDEPEGSSCKIRVKKELRVERFGIAIEDVHKMEM